ncbi:hypothetical protein [Thiothrix fructosivorans]|uniref:Uncharacterized protein n=1 Tax=Thiothrix fructosivorans TaxID=111770 RepID=A0A8B0SGS1_9GAMM|nr:hypothetical protein [Thiothrix fructosivorans]MBO0615272.1 hypothetical protein [Thiothrix fructosivorans]QTX10055.1 hypothetical protein J1836_015840 [Thiothrix fructosivorans]
MTMKNALQDYQLSGDAAADVQAFHNEMLRIRLATMEAATVQQPGGKIAGKELMVLHGWERLDESSAMPITRKEVTAEHVRIAESLAHDISAKMEQTENQRNEAVKKLKALTEQESKITQGYKALVLADDEKGIQKAEKDAVTIVGERKRYEIRRDGYTDATKRLELDFDAYNKIAKACRRSLLRQQALIAIDEYKTAVEAFAPAYNRVAAFMDLSGQLLYQDDGFGMSPLAYLRKAMIEQPKPFERDPLFDDLKHAIMSEIEQEISPS